MNVNIEYSLDRPMRLLDVVIRIPMCVVWHSTLPLSRFLLTLLPTSLRLCTRVLRLPPPPAARRRRPR